MFRNFSKKTLVSGFGSKQPLQQQSTPAYFIGPVFSMVWFCEMFLFCLLNLSLFSCLAVNNCIGNMLDFPEISHATRSFLNQSDCRTFRTSILKKQAILNMYLDIIEGLDILGTNVFVWLWSTQECPQLCLDESNSKILETPITQEKF